MPVAGSNLPGKINDSSNVYIRILGILSIIVRGDIPVSRMELECSISGDHKRKQGFVCVPEMADHEY